MQRYHAYAGQHRVNRMVREYERQLETAKKPSPLQVLRDRNAGHDVRCEICPRFIGPMPMGWCERRDEQQWGFGICLDFEG